MKSKPNPVSNIGGASDSVPQALFKRNLRAFLAYAEKRDAWIVKAAVWIEGVLVSNDIRQDLAEYLKQEGLYDKPMDPQRFWKHLIFRHNCKAFTTYIRRKLEYWKNGWHNEEQKILNVVRKYLSAYDKAYEKIAHSSQCDYIPILYYESLLTDEEMGALWENLLRDAFGVKTQVTQYIIERNLEVFHEFAREQGAEVNDDGSVVFKGVVLTGIRQALSDVGGDREPVDPEWVWGTTMFECNLEAFVAFAKQKGAVIGDDGKLVFKGVTLTDDIEREVDHAGGVEEPIDPQDLWRHLMKRTTPLAF